MWTGGEQERKVQEKWVAEINWRHQEEGIEGQKKGGGVNTLFTYSGDDAAEVAGHHERLDEREVTNVK